jgi:hypothetical protein
MILWCPRPTSGRRAEPPNCRCVSFLRKVLFFAFGVPDRNTRSIADQREARVEPLRAAFRLDPLEEFALGTLHGEGGFGVGLELSEAIQFRQRHLWL